MNLAIIGFGGMAGHHANMLEVYAQTRPKYPLTVTGVYDIDPAAAQNARARGFRAYDSAEQLFADKSVDAVLVATPNDFHKPYVIAAAAAGKHVISEKPVALSSAEAEEMYAAAERAGVVFEVHQNRRWDEDYLTVRGIEESGEIGGVYRVESRVMGANGIPGAWRKIKAQGGGMMLDWGVHLIDQMLLSEKQKTASVYCEYSYIYGEEVDDGFRLTVKFEDGKTWFIEVDTNCFRALPRWQVYGTDGTATVADWDISGGVTRVKEREDKNLKGVKAGNGFTKTMAKRSDSSVEKSDLSVVRAEPFAFYKNFAAACAGDEQPVVRRDQVLRVFRLMETARDSAERGEVISISI